MGGFRGGYQGFRAGVEVRGCRGLAVPCHSVASFRIATLTGGDAPQVVLSCHAHRLVIGGPLIRNLLELAQLGRGQRT